MKRIALQIVRSVGRWALRLLRGERHFPAEETQSPGARPTDMSDWYSVRSTIGDTALIGRPRVGITAEVRRLRSGGVSVYLNGRKVGELDDTGAVLAPVDVPGIPATVPARVVEEMSGASRLELRF